MLAQAATEDGQQQAAAVETDLINQVLDALKNPSGDHMQIYVQLGVALVLVAGLVYAGLQAMKPKEQLMFTMADAEGDKPKKRARVKKPQGAPQAAVASPAKKDDDWEDYDFDKDAMFKELDEAGPFAKKLTGTLEPEAFYKFRQIVMKYTFLAFADRKEELMQNRLTFFKSQRWQEYAKQIATASRDYQVCMKQVTMHAGQFIDLDGQCYEATVRESQQDQELMQRLAKIEEETRLVVDQSTEVRSKEELKQILMEKIKLEAAIEKKMSQVTASSLQEAQGLFMIERTKVMDTIYLKYNIKMAEIMRGTKKYDLDNDDDIKALKAANNAQREQVMKERQAANQLPQDQLDRIIAMVKEAGGPITVEGGLLSMDDYLKVFSVVVRAILKATPSVMDASCEERRKLLAEKKEREYSVILKKSVAQMMRMKQMATIAIIKEFGLEPELYNQSQAALRQDPANGPTIQATASKIEQEERALQSKRDVVMPREETLECVEFVEIEKAKFMAPIVLMAKSGKVPPQEMPVMTELAKQRAFDLLFNDKQVEEYDVLTSFHENKIQDSDEFKEIAGKA